VRKIVIQVERWWRREKGKKGGWKVEQEGNLKM